MQITTGFFLLFLYNFYFLHNLKAKNWRTNDSMMPLHVRNLNSYKKMSFIETIFFTAF